MSKRNTQNQPPVKLLQRIIKCMPYKHHCKAHWSLRLAADKGWRVSQRIQPDYLCLLFYDGKPVIEINQHKVQPEKGQLIFVSPGNEFEAYASSQNLPTFIGAKFMLYANDSNNLIRPPQTGFWFLLEPTQTEHCRNLLELIHQYSVSGESRQHSAACSSALHLLLTELAAQLGRTGPGFDPRIEKVRRFIDDNPSVRTSISELAQKAGLSKKYFERIFISAANKTPKAYEIASRCRYARYLLEETEMSVKQVALSLGYPDQYSFSKQFKNVTQMNPSACKNLASSHIGTQQ